jgi:HEAT repeat protein
LNPAEHVTQEERVKMLATALRSFDEDDKEAIRAELDAMHGTEIIARDLESSDPETRILAAEMMAHVPAPEGVDPLIRALSDPVPRVRELCAAALWLYAEPRAVEPLAAALADPDPEVRSAAAQSLGRLGGERAVEALVEAELIERDDFVRLLIRASLRLSR